MPLIPRPRNNVAFNTSVERTSINSEMFAVLLAIGIRRAASRGMSVSIACPTTNGKRSVKTKDTAIPIALTETSSIMSGTTSGMYMIVSGIRRTRSEALRLTSALAASVSLRRNGAPAAVPTRDTPVANEGSSERRRDIPSASSGTRMKLATSARNTRSG